MGLKEAEDLPFKYTTISLNKVYEIAYKHALEMIHRNGGNIQGDKVNISVQTPAPVKFEQSFEGLYPVEKKGFYDRNFKELNFEFEGTGFVLKGEARKLTKDMGEHAFEAELYIDGLKQETSRFPANFTTRRHELFWKYLLPDGKHRVTMKVLNPKENFEMNSTEYIIYRNKPLKKGF